MYHAKKIGVFISHIFGDYQKNICQGIIDRAIDYGYIVEIFHTTDGENLGKYGIGEGSILRVPNFNEFQGIIFASETYPSLELRDRIRLALQEKCPCPIIEINRSSKQFPSIILENNTITGQLVTHLIREHHLSRICYLGCNQEAYYSELRLRAYQEAMAKNQRSIGNYDTYECNYSETAVTKALSYFLQEDKPDAIVCYNDRMALLLMIALLKAGYSVPEDIAVTGCDNLEEGQNITPKLTTVSFPVYELGTTAIEHLMKMIHKQEIPASTTVYAEPVLGASCGCKAADQPNTILFDRKLMKRIEKLESSIIDSMRMAANFQGITDIDEGMDLLSDTIEELDNCSEFYLCLYSDWDLISNHIRELTLTEEEIPDEDTILLKLAVKNGKRLPECSFTKKSILPDFIYKNSQSAYIFTPLFFEEKEFGYTAIAYKNNQIAYHFQLIHWLQIINQMLESIYDAKKTLMLVNRLETLYLNDFLTGLFNTYGFNRQKQSLIEEAVKAKDTICCFVFDMNGLKTINDQYGHQEGDFSIRVIAHAIESSANHGDICARFSGDEFFILARGYNSNTAKDLIDNVYKYLSHYNKLSSKPYNITVSGGFSLANAAELANPYDTDELFDEADKKMYLVKKSCPVAVIKN